MNYAGFWIRAGAAFIDTIILMIAGSVSSVLITYSLLLIIYLFTDVFQIDYIDVLQLFTSFAIGVLYFSIFESSTMKATPGKKMLGLIVTDMDGERISFGRAFLRYFARLISGLLLFLGYLMLFFTAKKQTLHDKLCGTLVLHTPSIEP